MSSYLCDITLAAFVTRAQVHHGIVETIAKGNLVALRMIQDSGLSRLFTEAKLERPLTEEIIGEVLRADDV